MLETIVIILVILWALGMVGGYAFGGLIHLLLVIIGIVAISVTPMAFEWLRVRRQR